MFLTVGNVRQAAMATQIPDRNNVSSNMGPEILSAPKITTNSMRAQTIAATMADLRAHAWRENKPRALASP